MNQFTKLQILGAVYILLIFCIGIYHDWSKESGDFKALETRMQYLQQDLIDDSLPKEQAVTIVNAIRNESNIFRYHYQSDSLVNKFMTMMLALGLFSITFKALKLKNKDCQTTPDWDK